jgi:hypothetical protein
MKSNSRHFLGTVLAACAAVALIAPGSATAAAKKKPTISTTTIPPGKAIKFSTTFDPSALTNAAQECRPAGTDPKGICAQIGFAALSFSGDITGTGLYAASTFTTSLGGFGQSGTIVFPPETTIGGCGPGAFVIQFGPSSTTETKSSGGATTRPGYWQIVTPKLTKTVGSGQIWPEPQPGGKIVVQATGTVLC